MHATFIPRSAILMLLSPALCNAGETPDAQLLQQQNAIIGEIVLQKSNVFDLSNPEENNWLYRLANRWHIVTKDRVIRKQLLIRSGSPYSPRLVAESGRVLRQNNYFFDADIQPLRYENGVVDLAVKTRDVWTLGPDVSASRKGGENTSRIGIEEQNLLGRGQRIRLSHEENVDRRSNSLEFSDRHLGSNWLSLFVRLADSSDGDTQQVSLTRPFFALDTRWSAGVYGLKNERRDTIYSLGEEAADYNREQDYFSAFGGWSKGVQNGWVRRWTAGIIHDQNQFTSAASTVLPDSVPVDRKLIYPFFGVELLEDRYETSQNRDQIGKTEDFYLGTRLTASLGYASERFSSDRDALMYSASANTSFGALDKIALLLSGSASGRLESGRTANALATLRARYYRTQSEKRLFFATVSLTAGQALDLDNLVQLGGSTGLRGYPLRYQNGDSRVIVSLEQRYFTDWYPFRLARIGGAVFLDSGRVWGDNPVGEQRYKWLTDIGIGLRFAPTRSSSGKMIHLDIAFPLGGDPTIDDVQVLLESKRSF
ncbi:MAG: hypothetical protein K0U72_02615 [Gammaproteobacteria bacterium]|nr:hypothetical protein [Gammaproteobacteria bacterium]